MCFGGMAKINAEAGVKELESRVEARLECAALSDIAKMTFVMLSFYKIKIE